MFVLLILALLRDIAGTTFLYHDENAMRKLICSKSSQQDETGWWFTDNSLQRFEQQSCNSTTCGKKCDPWASRRTEGKELNFNSSHGRIVACKNLTGIQQSNQSLLFSNEKDCRDFDFFIVAKTQSKIETKVDTINIQEDKNLSLPCQFNLKKNTGTFAVYWIKETDGSTCLFSASNEGCYSFHVFSYDINCCVDAGIKARRLNYSQTLDEKGLNQSHGITIVNVTSSDSGTYLCIVGFLRSSEWMIVTNISVNMQVTNISVNVQEEPLAPSSFKEVLQITLGIIGGVFLLGGITLFLCCKKKSKGKPPEIHQRDQPEMEGDDCSPYAISNRNNTAGYEVIYSLATHPGIKPNADASLMGSKLDSGRCPGDNLQTIYALVDKKKRP